MSTRVPVRGPILALTLLLACRGEDAPSAAPWGFQDQPVQRFRLESDEQTVVDGERAEVQRYADFRLVHESVEKDRHELALYLERYYLRVKGAPDGGSEIALSERGLVIDDPERGRLRLGPTDPRPGGGPVAELLERPVAGCELSEQGRILGSAWTSFDPILSGVSLLDWVLLAFPLLDEPGRARWSGRRRVPPLGQYRLGIELPLFYERVGERVRASGQLRRSRLEVAPGFEGALELDLRGETELGEGGGVQQSTLELGMRFESSAGALVSALYRTRIRCLDCSEPINSPPGTPDTTDEE
ncbi:MAG: hypothetical protein ACE5FG_03445 [Myxococcota bacterium]